MLKVKHVNKNFGKRKVLDDICLELENGCYGLLGPNVPRYEQETGSLFRHLQLWRELYT